MSPQEEPPADKHPPLWPKLQNRINLIKCPGRKADKLQLKNPDPVPALRSITPDVLMTSPCCMFAVAMIHLFRAPPATRAISADLHVDRERLSSVFGVHIKVQTAGDLTCTGRIALQQPSPQKACPPCWVHSADDGSRSTCIFAYDRRRCRVHGFFLEKEVIAANASTEATSLEF